MLIVDNILPIIYVSIYFVVLQDIAGTQKELILCIVSFRKMIILKHIVGTTYNGYLL